MTNTTVADSSLSSFVEQQAKGAFYYDPKWLDLICSLYGCELIPLSTSNGAGQDHWLPSVVLHAESFYWETSGSSAIFRLLSSPCNGCFQR